MLKRSSTQEQEVGETSFPLFFKKPTPLDAKRHEAAGLLPPEDLSFARDTNSILINASEFFEASKYYPVVFTAGENPSPAVLVGLEQENYFVSPKGQWQEGTYIPAYVRKYPFAFMSVNQKDGEKLVLCVDEGASSYQEKASKKASPFFSDDKPSELAKNAMDFCVAYQNHHTQTQQFCEAIKAAGLFSPTSSTAKLENGREIRLGGFQMIDEKKVSDLPDDVVIDLFRKGYLPLIYAALMSASNWKKLANLASTKEPSKKSKS